MFIEYLLVIGHEGFVCLVLYYDFQNFFKSVNKKTKKQSWIRKLILNRIFQNLLF